MTIRRAVLLSGLFLTPLLAGCQQYYMVQDPSGGKIFYTQKFDRQDSGAIVFKDLKTGNIVTLQNSEVKEVHQGDLPPDIAK